MKRKNQHRQLVVRRRKLIKANVDGGTLILTDTLLDMILDSKIRLWKLMLGRSMLDGKIRRRSLILKN